MIVDRARCGTGPRFFERLGTPDRRGRVVVLLTVVTRDLHPIAGYRLVQYLFVELLA